MDKKNALRDYMDTRQKVEAARLAWLHYKETGAITKKMVTDEAYDQLVNRLAELEKTIPEAAAINSPLELADGMLKQGDQAIPHTVRVVRFKRVYRWADLAGWLAANSRSNPEYLLEFKLDGRYCQVTYRDQKLVSVISRGTGIEGVDLTSEAIASEAIPVEVKKSVWKKICDDKGIVVFDGEQILPESSTRQGYTSVKSALAAKKGFRIAVTNIRQGSTAITALEHYKLLKKEGFLVVTMFSLGNTLVKNPVTATELTGFFAKHIADDGRISTDKIRCMYQNSEYPADGFMVKLNDLNARDDTTKVCSWQVAFKATVTHQNTKVLGCSTSVGKNGMIIPCLDVMPVRFGDIRITSIPMANTKKILQNGVRFGDTIAIDYAGSAMPSFVKLVSTDMDRAYAVPRYCDFCGSKLVYRELRAFCVAPDCSGLAEAVIRRIFERMKLQGFGGAMAAKLVANGVRYFANLLQLGQSYELFIEKTRIPPDTSNSKKLFDALADGLRRCVYQPKSQAYKAETLLYFAAIPAAQAKLFGSKARFVPSYNLKPGDPITLEFVIVDDDRIAKLYHDYLEKQPYTKAAIGELMHVINTTPRIATRLAGL